MIIVFNKVANKLTKKLHIKLFLSSKNILLLLSSILLISGFLYSYLSSKNTLSDGFSNAIRSDGLGYYAWTLLFMGETSACFDTLRNAYENYSPSNSWVLKPIPDSNCYLPIYPFGLGFLLSPVYLLAKMVSVFFSNQIALGFFSIPFQFAISASGLIFFIIGINYFLKISNFFNLNIYIKYFAVFSLILGTNIFHYATYDGIFSHAASFAINSIVIFFAILFEKRGYLENYQAFFFSFLIFIGSTIRLTNITFILLLFLIFKNWSKLLLKNQLFFLLGILSGSIILFFQFLLWYNLTGNFFYFTYYEYEGFNFNPLLVFKILFSFNPHGLLPWSPILLLVVFGVLSSIKFNNSIFLLSLLIFSTNSLIFASWSQPFGGGAFGNRLFIDLYPLLFISFLSVFAHKNLYYRFAMIFYALLSVVITTILTLHYWQGNIDFGGVEFQKYFSLLGQNIFN